MKGLARYWPVLVVILALILAGCGGQAAPEDGAPADAGTALPGEASASGDVVITEESAAVETPVKIGEKIVLKLNPEWTWQTTVTPSLIASKVADAQLLPDEQGLFVVKMNGSAVIQAIGVPNCAKDTPACPTPQAMLLFKLKVRP